MLPRRRIVTLISFLLWSVLLLLLGSMWSTTSADVAQTTHPTRISSRGATTRGSLIGPSKAGDKSATVNEEENEKENTQPPNVIEPPSTTTSAMRSPSTVSTAPASLDIAHSPPSHQTSLHKLTVPTTLAPHPVEKSERTSTGDERQRTEGEEILPATQSDYDAMVLEESQPTGADTPALHVPLASEKTKHQHDRSGSDVENQVDGHRPPARKHNDVEDDGAATARLTPRPSPTPRPPPVIIRSREHLLERIKEFASPNRSFRRPRLRQGPPTPSPYVAGSPPCPLLAPPANANQNTSSHGKKSKHKKLKHTGKRALVIYSLTHRDTGVVYSAEMDNFAFFAQHGLLPEGFKTALFTQVDYIIQRVLPQSNTTRASGNCTRGVRSKNVEVVALPAGPCDICSVARTLQHYGINESSTKYAYVVAINSGTRGPFFTMPPSPARTCDNDGEAHVSERAGPFTWVDYMALGGSSQFSDNTVTAAAGSAVMISHFQTYTFGLPTKALESMLPFFADTCAQPDKNRCILAGELMSAVEVFKSHLLLRSLLQHPTRTAGDMAGFDLLMRRSGIFAPLTSRVIKPCQMLFVKFGGEAYRRQKFPRSYVDAVVSQTLAQAQVAARVPSSGAGSSVFGRAYLGCVDEVQ